jgi:hypothetical protein
MGFAPLNPSYGWSGALKRTLRTSRQSTAAQPASPDEEHFMFAVGSGAAGRCLSLFAAVKVA